MLTTRNTAVMPNATYASVGGLPYFLASRSDRIPNRMLSGAQQNAKMMPSTPHNVVLSLPAAAGGGGYGAVKVSSFYGHALRVHVIAMIVAADQGRVKRRPGASSSDGGVYQVEHDPQNEQTDADQDANAPTDGASQCHSLVVGQALVGLFH